jgi:hypothetical protein
MSIYRALLDCTGYAHSYIHIHEEYLRAHIIAPRSLGLLPSPLLMPAPLGRLSPNDGGGATDEGGDFLTACPGAARRSVREPEPGAMLGTEGRGCAGVS